MSRSLALLYFLLCFQTHLSLSVSVPIPSMNGEIDEMLAKNGVIGEEEGEKMMPSEISRRVMMMRKQYISYGTLRRDMVPCQKPGASYYACRSGQANSYTRGCSIITRCARDTNDIKT